MSKLDWIRDGSCAPEPATVGLDVKAIEGTAAGQAAIRKAKNLCATCPVLGRCREFAINDPQPFGIWGGLTPKEVRAERRRRLRAAAGANRGDSGGSRSPGATEATLARHTASLHRILISICGESGSWAGTFAEMMTYADGQGLDKVPRHYFTQAKRRLSAQERLSMQEARGYTPVFTLQESTPEALAS